MDIKELTFLIFFWLRLCLTCCVCEVTVAISSGKNLVYTVLLCVLLFHDVIERLHVWTNYRPVYEGV
jgi:hypothetical protein